MRHNMNKAQIFWQNWVDPYHQDDANIFMPEKQDYVAQTQEQLEAGGGNFSDPIDFDELEEEEESEGKPIRTLFGPFGPIPLTDYSSPSKIFNLWVGHTNFTLTEQIVQEIESVPGVETLDVYTRYRFRIGFGQVFKDSNVMNRINEVVSNIATGETYESA